MIHRGSSNIDFVQGFIGYGNPEGITDWRIANILSGASGNLNIFNSVSQTSRLTILESGNVGIGNTNPGSILDIGGDVNITGVYKKGNRDVISDTSNYVVATSNILAPRILTDVGHGSNYTNRLITALQNRIENTSNYIAGANFLLTNSVSSQWTNVSTGIHYTPTIAQGIAITSSPSATTIGTTGASGEYTYQVFTYTTETAGAGTGQSLYTINVPTGGVVCDILVVGGGGGGGDPHGGGGGAGQLVFINQATLNGTYTIKVGKGGTGGVFITPPPTKGSNSEFGTVIAEGGGTNGGTNTENKNGGSGAGGDGYTINGGTSGAGNKNTTTDLFPGATVYSRGNNGGSEGAPERGGGGGGAGEQGQSGSFTIPGKGGDGLSGISEINFDFKTNFGNFGKLETDGKYYFAGGGGGGNTTVLNSSKGGGAGGIGGSRPNSLGGDATPNTGSGGGGGGGGSDALGGAGGSGIIIIRYLSTINVSVTKNVGIGTTNPSTELYVYDDTTNNTIVTVQNNYTDPVIVNPATGYTVAETLESGIYYKTLTFPYSPNYPDNPTGTLLLAGYKFNGNGNDDTGVYNLVANSGTPTYSSGTTADSFLQGRRYINTSTGSLRNTSLSLASRAFSIAYWVRHKNTSGSVVILQTITNSIVSAAFHIGTRNNNGYFLGFLSNDLECGTGVSGNPTTYPDDVNTWVHLVYVVLPNYNRRIYRNGVLIATDTNITACTCSGDLRIGAQFENISQNVDISDLRIYSTGLSAIDVATLYASYTSLIITDNYTINFNKSMPVTINNGVSTTVNGQYNISLGHINSSVLPAAGQTVTPLALTATTSVAIKYELTQLLPNLISVSGATSATLSSTDRYISFPYTSDSTGLTGQTQYTFTTTENLICDILIVGGGGGGGQAAGGGGGAGGLIYLANQNISAGTFVSVIVGNGGTATLYQGGYNSSFMNNIAIGGGVGATMSGTNPGNGGSGGGGNRNNIDNASVPGQPGGSGTIGQGNSGGQGKNFSGSNTGGGGGGGAGAAGVSAFTTGRGANGGIGLAYSITGTSTFYAGGGGGGSGSDFNTAGSGGLGGGGNGSIWANAGGNASANTGGGGGGGSAYPGDGRYGGNGGSGIVIIRYRKPTSAALELISRGTLSETPIPGTTITTVPGTFDRCILFPYTSDSVGLTGQTSYTFTTTEALTCDILIVGGGGGGDTDFAGGGGGGAVLYATNINIPANTYNIKVGNGGGVNVKGFSTEAFGAICLGGGSTPYVAWSTANNGTSGGSGSGGSPGNTSGTGGGVGVSTKGTLLSSGTLYNGNIGGNGLGVVDFGGMYGGNGGGGGGAGTAGFSSIQARYTTRDSWIAAGRPSSGGDGIPINITGTNYYWGAGGGGGGANTHSGDGGLGGGGAGGSYLSLAGLGGTGGINVAGNVVIVGGIHTGGNGAQNTGSGGGGGGSAGTGGKGGSGIVIIRYRRTIDNKKTYKVGNYGGDLKVISSASSGDTDFIRITSAGSSIYNPTGSPQWSTASDKRIKENIEKASYDRCYDSINNLELYRFNYISDFNNINKDRQQLGYIAQEVQGIFPKAVSTEQFYNNNLSIPDLLTIDIAQINYSLYGAVKKLMEIDNKKEKRLKNIERLLNIISSDTTTSNLTNTDTTTSNLTNTDTTTSNLTNTDTTTSNLTITDTTTSNLTNTDTTTSNLTNTDMTTSNFTTEDM